MTPIDELDQIAINVKSHRLVRTLLKENPKLEQILRNSKNEIEARIGIREWVLEELSQRPQALAYYEARSADRQAFEALVERLRRDSLARLRRPRGTPVQ